MLQTATKTWNAVLAPPTRMENRGLPKGALKVGNTATVVGYPNRNKPDEMRAERITVDGKTVELPVTPAGDTAFALTRRRSRWHASRRGCTRSSRSHILGFVTSSARSRC
jgi:hypothetical protein